MKHFKISEFDSPDLPGSGKNMNQDFLEMLDKARDSVDIIFEINSGYRTPEHNKSVGGSPTSSHLKGYASDIKCTNSIDRWKIVNALISVGFKRLGIAKTFIHVDNDPNKNNAIWVYPINE
jgi:zinc D-Ala-D-Ala carboxypeptidase